MSSSSVFEFDLEAADGNQPLLSRAISRKPRSPAAAEVHEKLQLARRSFVARERFAQQANLIHSHWTQRKLIPALTVKDLEAEKDSHLESVYEALARDTTLYELPRDFCAENVKANCFGAASWQLAARASDRVAQIEERTSRAEEARERRSRQKEELRHEALMRPIRMRQERMRLAEVRADRTRVLLLVSLLALGSRSSVLHKKLDDARFAQRCKTAALRLQQYFRAKRLHVAFTTLIFAIGTFRRLALMIPVKIKIWQLRRNTRILKAWLRQLSEIKATRRAITTLCWSVKRLQRWWRWHRSGLDDWLRVAVLFWERFEKAERLEKVDTDVKMSVLLEDYKERRLIFVRELGEYRLAARLREYARGSAAFRARRRARLGGAASKKWLETAALYDADHPMSEWAHEGETVFGDELEPGQGLVDAPSSPRPSRSNTIPNLSSNKPTLNNAARRANTLMPPGSPGKRGRAQGSNFGGQGEGEEALLNAADPVDTFVLTTVPAVASEFKSSVGSRPEQSDTPERRKARRSMVATPFRVSLLQRAGERDKRAQEDATLTSRVYGDAEMERYVVSVQRAIRGHQLRRVLLFSHGDIPLLPIAPKWRPLPSTDRLPKLISRSRARLRNWKESGSQFTRSHRAKRISEAGAIDDRLLLAEAVDLEALRPKKKSLKEVIRGGDTDE